MVLFTLIYFSFKYILSGSFLSIKFHLNLALELVLSCSIRKRIFSLYFY